MIVICIYHHQHLNLIQKIGNNIVFKIINYIIINYYYREWKSNGIGEDAISIYGYASEFQKSQLNSLFISVYGKKAAVSSCSLQIEILSLPSEEILQKLGLRGGGQVLLPRDVKDLKAIGKSRNQNSNIKKTNSIPIKS